MNSVATIIAAVSVIAVFWMLHIYAVRRARYLVKIELESFSEKMAEREELAESESTFQDKDTFKNSPKKQAARGIKPRPINQNDRTVPSMAIGTER